MAGRGCTINSYSIKVNGWRHYQRQQKYVPSLLHYITLQEISCRKNRYIWYHDYRTSFFKELTHKNVSQRWQRRPPPHSLHRFRWLPNILSSPLPSIWNKWFILPAVYFFIGSCSVALKRTSALQIQKKFCKFLYQTQCMHFWNRHIFPDLLLNIGIWKLFSHRSHVSATRPHRGGPSTLARRRPSYHPYARGGEQAAPATKIKLAARPGPTTALLIQLDRPASIGLQSQVNLFFFLKIGG
jgi:hypothetical protein